MNKEQLIETQKKLEEVMQSLEPYSYDNTVRDFMVCGKVMLVELRHATILKSLTV